MPVIINELVIRASVSETPANGGNANAPSANAGNVEEREALIKECVEQVMEILERQKER